MNAIIRLLGSAVAAAGTLSQLAVIIATVPLGPRCSYAECRGGHPGPWFGLDVWRPFVDNADGRARADREPRCPAPRGRDGRHGLAAAPLPDGYDPHAYGERTLYACVLVDWEGTVREVRMLRGTGRTAGDRSLVAAIRGSWRFRPDPEDPRPSSWQRVRLSSGPAGGAIYVPPILE